jgi:hypothetical protein
MSADALGRHDFRLRPRSGTLSMSEGRSPRSYEKHCGKVLTESATCNFLTSKKFRRRRMRGFEATGLQPQNLDGWLESGLLVLIQRNMASAERSFHKALAALRQLQKDRGFVPSNPALVEQSVGQTVSAVCQQESAEPPIGFVSQNVDSAPTSNGFVPQNSNTFEWVPSYESEPEASAP